MTQFKQKQKDQNQLRFDSLNWGERFFGSLFLLSILGFGFWMIFLMLWDLYKYLGFQNFLLYVVTPASFLAWLTKPRKGENELP